MNIFFEDDKYHEDDMQEFKDEDLIAYLCIKVEGINEWTAIHIAGYMETFLHFYEHLERLSNFKTSKGNVVVTESQILGIKLVLKDYIIDASKPTSEIWTYILIKDFVKKAVLVLQNIRIENLSIDTFLMKTVGFTSYKEVITVYLYQKITEYLVNSWGFTFDSLLRCNGAIRLEMVDFNKICDKKKLNYRFENKVMT